MIDLSGKRAVVTGAASGIGQATAIALARAGADVCSFSLPDEAGAERTRSAIAAAGRRAMIIDGDVTQSEQVDAAAERVAKEWGAIDIWVNNASMAYWSDFLEMPDGAWHGVMASNLFGYYYGCRAALRRMVPVGRGNIVNISSQSLVQPVSGLSAYVTAKGGVVGLTRALALEYGARGIIINSLSPGGTETAITADFYTPAVRRGYNQRIAIGRLAQPTDIADVAVFLASDAARYICGQDILADGGLSMNGNVAPIEEVETKS